MNFLDKLLEIATNIKKIYDDLSEVEASEFFDESAYQEKIEYLELYKEVEDKYYEKVKNLSLDEINKMLNIVNCDDVIEKYTCDLKYAYDKVFNNDSIINRRVYMK